MVGIFYFEVIPWLKAKVFPEVLRLYFEVIPWLKAKVFPEVLRLYFEDKVFSESP